MFFRKSTIDNGIEKTVCHNRNSFHPNRLFYFLYKYSVQRYRLVLKSDAYLPLWFSEDIFHNAPILLPDNVLIRLDLTTWIHSMSSYCRPPEGKNTPSLQPRYLPADLFPDNRRPHWGLTPMWSTKYPFLVFQNQLSIDQFIHVLDDSLRGCNV